MTLQAVTAVAATTQAELSRLNLKPKLLSFLLRVTFVALISKLMGGRLQDPVSSEHYVTSNARTIN